MRTPFVGTARYYGVKYQADKEVTEYIFADDEAQAELIMTHLHPSAKQTLVKPFWTIENII